MIVCLGAIPAKLLFGNEFKVIERRGQLLKSDLAAWAMATVHPASILRAPDDEARHLAERRFVADLKKIPRP